MTYRPELPHTELPRGARTRIRLPEDKPSAGIFPGWGPKL
jgi:hypothetical protein